MFIAAVIFCLYTPINPLPLMQPQSFRPHPLSLPSYHPPPHSATDESVYQRAILQNPFQYFKTKELIIVKKVNTVIVPLNCIQSEITVQIRQKQPFCFLYEWRGFERFGVHCWKQSRAYNPHFSIMSISPFQTSHHIANLLGNIHIANAIPLSRLAVLLLYFNTSMEPVPFVFETSLADV